MFQGRNHGQPASYDIVDDGKDDIMFHTQAAPDVPIVGGQRQPAPKVHSTLANERVQVHAPWKIVF